MIGAVSQITNLATIFEEFMYQAYQEFLQDRVQYIEFRSLLMPICKVGNLKISSSLSPEWLHQELSRDIEYSFYRSI